MFLNLDPLTEHQNIFNLMRESDSDNEQGTFNDSSHQHCSDMQTFILGTMVGLIHMWIVG